MPIITLQTNVLDTRLYLNSAINSPNSRQIAANTVNSRRKLNHRSDSKISS